MRALVCVDLQQRYTDSLTPEAKQGVTKALDKARRCRVPVIHVMHDISHEDVLKFNHILAWMEKQNIHGFGQHRSAPLKCAWPKQKEPVVMKGTFDSFFRTCLKRKLRELGLQPRRVAGIKDDPGDTVIVCGLLTGVCVLSTALSACALGYRVIVLSDACADDPTRHNFVLSVVYPEFASVLSVDDVFDDHCPRRKLPPDQNLQHHVPACRSGRSLQVAGGPEILIVVGRQQSTRGHNMIAVPEGRVFSPSMYNRLKQAKVNRVVLTGTFHGVAQLFQAVLDGFNQGFRLVLVPEQIRILGTNQVGRRNAIDLLRKFYEGQMFQVSDTPFV
jgi:nicotinamidase-related amidase